MFRLLRNQLANQNTSNGNSSEGTISYTYSLLEALQGMIGDPGAGPRDYLYFQGGSNATSNTATNATMTSGTTHSSALLLPRVVKWPNTGGWTFSTWYCLNTDGWSSQGTPDSSHNTPGEQPGENQGVAYEPVLISLRQSNGAGLSVCFCSVEAGQKMVLESEKDGSKGKTGRSSRGEKNANSANSATTPHRYRDMLPCFYCILTVHQPIGSGKGVRSGNHKLIVPIYPDSHSSSKNGTPEDRTSRSTTRNRHSSPNVHNGSNGPKSPAGYGNGGKHTRNEWHHLAITVYAGSFRVNGNVCLYIDGIPYTHPNPGVTLPSFKGGVGLPCPIIGEREVGYRQVNVDSAFRGQMAAIYFWAQAIR